MFVPYNPGKYIANIYQDLQNHINFDSDQEIMFSNIPFGQNIERVKRIKGKAFKYEIFKYSNNQIKLLMYKNIIEDRKRISLYYFIDDLLAVGEHIYISPLPSEFRIFRKAASDKYKFSVPEGQNIFCITGANEIKIFFQKSSNLKLTYLSPQATLPQFIFTEKSIENQSKDSLNNESNFYKLIYDTL